MASNLNLVFHRVFDVPVERVWRAWTEPEQVMQWWGPDHFTCPVAKMDVREGGRTLVCMRAPKEFGGQDMYSTWTYTKIVPLKEIEYLHHFADKDGNRVEPAAQGLPPDMPSEVRNLVVLKALGDHQTAVTVTEFDWPDTPMREMSRQGMEQCLDKMAASLAASPTAAAKPSPMQGPGALQVTTPSDREVAMTREFNAPRHLVFDAWTKPELLKRWLYGPDGWSFAVCEMDMKPGGAIRWVWRGPDGTEMGLRGVYREITHPERIVHTELFDEDWTGGETLVTVEFAEQNARTTVTMTILYSSKDSRDGALKSGMEMGMEMGYQRLDEMLAARAN